MDTSIFTKAGTILEHAKRLFLLEMLWLKKEMKDTAQGITIGILLAITGIFVIVSAINALMDALLISLVAAGLSPLAAASLMAFTLALLGGITLFLGIKKINASLDMSQAVKHIERDTQAVKGGLHEKT